MASLLGARAMPLAFSTSGSSCLLGARGSCFFYRLFLPLAFLFGLFAAS